ncbi:MAG: hypothetical protein L3J18_08375 [Candidatus Brocadia sp.]|nr:MAG: hypothetical protein L3J18_08375 [Candidatus Brocadia sp.]
MENKELEDHQKFLIKIPCKVFRYGRGFRVSLPSLHRFIEVFQQSEDRLFRFVRGFL